VIYCRCPSRARTVFFHIVSHVFYTFYTVLLSVVSIIGKSNVCPMYDVRVVFHFQCFDTQTAGVCL